MGFVLRSACKFMKRYRIADLTVDMDVSGRTAKQAQAYAVPCEGAAQITLQYDLDELMALNPHITSRDMAEHMVTGMLFSRELLRFDGTYLHASAVILNGRAYLFSAPSGTGKSTHTEKWCRLFGAVYLNDDKPAVRQVNGIWHAYGTPWSGKHDISLPMGAPIGGIAFLKRGQENTIRRLSPAEALPLIFNQSLWKLRQEQMQKQLALLDGILRQIPVWELSCRNDDEAAMVSRAAMEQI